MFDIAQYTIEHQSGNHTDIENYKTRNLYYIGALSKINHQKITLAKEWKAKNMDVVGWGAGVCFFRNIRMIKEVYDLKYVCDRDPEKWGQIFEGVKCISPKTLSEMTNVAVVIMVDSPSTCLQISDEILDMGISHVDHVENWIKTLKGEI